MWSSTYAAHTLQPDAVTFQKTLLPGQDGVLAVRAALSWPTSTRTTITSYTHLSRTLLRGSVLFWLQAAGMCRGLGKPEQPFLHRP